MGELSRAVVGFLRGGSHPRAVGWAVYLGALAGFATGVNLSLAALVHVAILLNVHTRTFLLAWGGGFALSWSLTPVTLRIGQFLLDRTPLGAQLARLGESSLIALLDWDRYTLVGGVALAGLGALPAAGAAARFVQSRQDLALRLREAARNDWSAGSEASGSPSGRARRLHDWRGNSANRQTPHSPRPIVAPWRSIRPLGAVALPIAFVMLFAFLYWAVPSLTGRALLNRLSELNGADVEAAAFDLSLADGRFEITGLAIADPVQLSRDRLRVERVYGRLRPGALLRGRLDVEHVEFDGMRTDVARRRPATLYDGQLSLGEKGDRNPSSDAIFGTLIPAASSKSNIEPVALNAYLRSWPAVRDQLGMLGELIGRLESLQLAEARSGGNLLVSGGATNLRAKRSLMERNQPAVRIEHLRADALPVGWGLGSSATLQLAMVTSRPAIASQPTHLAIVAPQMNTDIEAALNFHQPGAKHEIRLSARQLDLTDYLDRRALGNRIAVREGTIHLIGAGLADRQGLDMILETDATGLDVTLEGDGAVGGISTQNWNDGLARLGRIYGQIALRGDWSEPQLVVDQAQLARQFKHQLRAAGAHELLAEIDTPRSEPQDQRQITSLDPSEPESPQSDERDVRELPVERPTAQDAGFASDDENHPVRHGPVEARPQHDSVPLVVEAHPTQSNTDAEPSARPSHGAAADGRRSIAGGSPLVPGHDSLARAQRRMHVTDSIARDVRQFAGQPPYGQRPEGRPPISGGQPRNVPARPQAPAGMGWTPPRYSGGTSGSPALPPVAQAAAPHGPVQWQSGYDPSTAGQSPLVAPQKVASAGSPEAASPSQRRVSRRGRRLGMSPSEAIRSNQATPWPTHVFRWVKRIVTPNKSIEPSNLKEEMTSVASRPAAVAPIDPATAVQGGQAPSSPTWYEQLWR